MGKKNMGKVKRYRRSFYSGRQRAARIGATVVGLVVLFAAGWLVGPAVINLGTHTWYSLTRPQSQGSSISQPTGDTSQPAQDTSQPDSQAQSQPQTTQQPAGLVTEGKSWSILDVKALTDLQAVQTLATQLKSQGVGYAVVPLKDSTGSVYYASGVAAAASSLSQTQIDAAAVAQALQQQGIVPVAGICAFQDPLASSANRDMAVKYQGGEYLWLDAAKDQGGKSWLNPYSAQAVGYISDLIEEAKTLGYQQIWLTGVQMPTTSGRDKASYGDTAGMSDSQCLANAISQWQQKADCWVEYPLNVASGAETRLTGGTIDSLGIQNLAIQADASLDQAGQEQLDQAKALAKGCKYLALVQGDTFTPQAVAG